MLKTKRFRRLLTVLLAVLMLSVGIPVAAFAAGEPLLTLTISIHDLSGKLPDGMQTSDYLTAGTHSYSEIEDRVMEIVADDRYEMTTSGDFYVDENNKTVDVNVAIMGTVNVSYVCDGVEVGTDSYTGIVNQYDLIMFNTNVLENVPANYEIVNTSDVSGKNGDTIQVDVASTIKTGTVTIDFQCDGVSVGTGSFTGNVSEAGYVTTSLSELNAPDGYTIPETGDVMGKPGETVVVKVEKIDNTVVMNIRFVTADGTFVAGGDYFLPEGVQNLSILEQYVPEGYRMTESGDFFVTEGGKEEITVEKIDNTVVMNIRFVTADGTFVAGGDYFLPEGVQNLSILEQYVPEGYRMTESGDFFVTEGGKEEITVEKIDNTVIMNIRFVTADGTFVAGGDYFLPEGIQNLSILERYVPEGYKMMESGDFTVTDGGKEDITVEKIDNTVIMNIRFVTVDGTFVAGGDYFLPEGIQNLSILEQYVPEGYRMMESGDFFVTDGGKEDITIEPIPASVTAKTAVFRKDNAEDVWNENSNNPDEVTYKFWSDDPEATNIVPSLTLADETKVLDHWVSELDEDVVLYPGTEFCYKDLDKGALKDLVGDFAFYPVYADAPVDPDQPTDPTDPTEPTTPPTEGGDTTTDNNSGNNNTTTVTSDDKKDEGEEVVKSTAAPADNTAKVLPQTGVQATAPIAAFVVVLAAALAGAACYLFVVRKKLN